MSAMPVSTIGTAALGDGRHVSSACNMLTEVELSTNNKSRDEIALSGDKQIPGHARAFAL